MTKESLFELVGAILRLAIDDANIPDSEIYPYSEKTQEIKLRIRQDARKFFYSKLFIDYCAGVGLDHERVRNMLTEEAKKEYKNDKF